MAKDKSKYLIPCFKNVDAYDIPKEFAKLQSQDMGKIGAIQDLLRGIEKLLSPVPKAEKVSSAENIVINNSGVNGNSLLKRGIMALEDEEWSKAIDFFEQVLNINAEDCHAYWGELLASYQCKDADELGKVLYGELIKDLSFEMVRADVPDKYAEFKGKYFFMDIFTEENINELFNTPFIYESKLPSLNRIVKYNRDNFVLDSNKIYQKVLRYSDEKIQAEIEMTKDNIEKLFEAMSKNITVDESADVNKIINISDSYYEKLENALRMANEVARNNADRNEAEFMRNHEQWVNEKDNFTQTINDWNRNVEKYKNDYQVWLLQNSEILKQYDVEKRKYSEEKKKYENEIMRLDDEILLAGERRHADRKKTEMRYEILTIRNQLKNLRIPQEPVLSPAPVEPSKPILRDEPIMNFEEKIGKDEVLRVFKECME
jgi:tetratricopeptide (TPR) repeat protein